MADVGADMAAVSDIALMSALVLLPAAGALICAAAAIWRKDAPRWVALGAALAQCVLVAYTLGRWAMDEKGFIVGSYGGGAKFTFWVLEVNGLSAPLVALTAVLTVVAVLASWKIEEAPGAHHALLLALSAATTGVFLAEDLILFYAFWEAVLIPMYFLIGKWGHERRKHAALKFFLYTFLGSALMLVGIIMIVLTTGTTSLSGAINSFEFVSEQGRGLAIFWLLAAGFLVKVPVFPLHTWLPDAHVEAPTAGSIMLAGVLLKMGGYGMIRLALPIAPDAFDHAAPVLAALGIAGIVYGAFVAMAQSDLKRLVAYSSVAHMGFVVLAVAVATPAALGAAMLVMVSHGAVSALLFLLVGLLYDRTHTREIARFGGLMRTIPAWGVAFSFGALASLGLPGLSGFPGEFLTVVESFDAYRWWLIVVVVGLVVSAAYHLWAIRRVNHGEERPEWSGMKDLDLRERLAVAPLAVAILLLGVWPQAVLAATDRFASGISTILGSM